LIIIIQFNYLIPKIGYENFIVMTWKGVLNPSFISTCFFFKLTNTIVDYIFASMTWIVLLLSSRSLFCLVVKAGASFHIMKYESSFANGIGINI